MNVRGDFLKFPYSTNTTALICKSGKENPQKLTPLLFKKYDMSDSSKGMLQEPKLLFSVLLKYSCLFSFTSNDGS